MIIINTTPHQVHIVDKDNNVVITFPKGDFNIRLSVDTVDFGTINGVPISKTVFGDPIGLPDFIDGTFFIVSQLVKSALPNRTDLLVPAQVVRDNNGNIIGCQSLGI
jgi:hypothetical protein